MLVPRLILTFALLTVSSASAQNLAPSARQASSLGVTVTGRGTAAVAPDRARVAITLFGSVGGASSGSLSLEDAANALRDAMSANGVADVREVLPIGNLNARNVTPEVVGVVARPTRERLESVARGVVKALPERFAPAFGNAQIQVALFADDCRRDEERAERAAFADARDRATRLAAIAGVRLGAVTGITESSAFLPSGCASKPDNIETNPTNIVAISSTYGPLILPITVSESVSFAIETM